MAKLIFISRLGSNDGTVNLSVSASNLWPLIKRSWQSSGHGWKRSKLSGSFLYNLIGSVRTMMFKKNGSKELQILVKNSTIFLTKLRVWDFKNISDVFKMLNWQNYPSPEFMTVQVLVNFVPGGTDSPSPIVTSLTNDIEGSLEAFEPFRIWKQVFRVVHKANNLY